MAEFGVDEDWGLQAIVRGSNNMAMINSTSNHPCSLGITQDDEADDDQDFLFSFSDHFVKSPMHLDDGLEALYKPFYPFPESITCYPSNVLAPKESKNDQEEECGKQRHVESHACSPTSSRKRKNQEKRVVNRVKAEDLSSDMWAWRKYGQKPIKGSPYPRSYYRCSSMKGCLARKQVDRSCTDTGVYIVTYTEEHCHSQPTKRNSLAGTVRQKFPTPDKSPSAGGSQSSSVERVVEGSNNSSKNDKNSIMGSFEEESNVEEEKLNESEDQIIEGGYANSNNEVCVSDVLMNDDFFSGLLEDLDDAGQFEKL